MTRAEINEDNEPVRLLDSPTMQRALVEAFGEVDAVTEADDWDEEDDL